MSLKKYVLDSIGIALNCGGGHVDQEQFVARLNKCSGCKFAGTVNPLPLLYANGCTICGCPFATKPATYKHCSLDSGKKVLTTCPHPDGNKWEEVDLLHKGYQKDPISIQFRFETVNKIFNK